MTRGQQTNPDRQWPLIFIAVFAMLIVQASRLSNHWTGWGVILEGLITLIAIYSLDRYLRWRDSDLKRLQLAYSAGLFGVILLPILAQFAIRPFGIGDPNELILLNMAQNIAVALAVIPYSKKSLQISSLLSGFLVLFVTSMTELRLIWIMSAVFGVTGLWCLMCSYWARLETKFVTSTHRIRPFRPMVISLVLLLSIGILTFASVGGSGGTLVLPGFMPTSGGNKSQDRYARSGVGDGDMLIAAEDSAFTFGPVDSRIFLESKMPSLYDVASDQYGEAKKKKKTNKEFNPAISITADRLRHKHRKTSRSEQASRQFNTLRRLTKQRTARPDDRSSTALLQISGPTPLHLVTERFDTFDGIEWSHSDRATQKLNSSLQTIEDKPWLKISRNSGTILRGKQSHTLRIINLKSKRIPSPSHVAGIHIADVNQASFFDMTDDGVFVLTAQEHIPRLTVIHLVSQVFSQDGLHDLGDFRDRYASSRDFNAKTSGQVALTAKRWTAGIDPGWKQVATIVETLRNNFTHDRQTTASDACENIVEEFLSTGRGPDYMFASAAAEILRSLGYESQVVMGFYADPDDYDAQSRQTIVESNALHFWTEVHVGDGIWIPVEPTPGYSHPQNWISWHQRIAMGLAAAGKWLLARWHLVVLAITVALLALLARHLLLDLGSFILWRAGWSGTARRRILWTVRILEFRARMAGQGRPGHTTIPKWYLSLAARHPVLGQDLTTLETVLSLADQAIYTPIAAGNDYHLKNHGNMYRTCCNLLSVWTSHRIKGSCNDSERMDLQRGTS